MRTRTVTLLFVLPMLIGLLTMLGCAGQPRAGAARASQGAVLMVLTNHGEMDGKPTGIWLAEAAHPYAVFRDAGYSVALASPAGGVSPIDPRSLRSVDAQGQAFLDRYASGEAIPGTLDLSNADLASYDAVFFVGGHGTMWDFPGSASVKRAGEVVYRNGGVVAAVCHGPAALVGMTTAEGVALVGGRRIAAFTNDEEDAVGLTGAVPFLLETRLRELGAVVEAAPNFEVNVVVDGRLVTGQNPASATATAEAVVRIMGSR